MIEKSEKFRICDKKKSEESVEYSRNLSLSFPEGNLDKEDRKTKGHFYPVTKEPTTPSQDVPRKRKTRHSQNPIQEMHVGWILDSRSRGGESTERTGRTRNSDSVCSDTQSLGSSYGTPQSLPTFHHPSHALLKENQFTQLQYSKYHSRCLKGAFNFMLSFLIVLIIVMLLPFQSENDWVRVTHKK